MIVPLFLASIINTFSPSLLRIGSFTTAVFSGEGSKTIIGLSLFFLGTSFKLKEAPEAIKRGSILLLTKLLAGGIIGIVVGKFFGQEGIFGISTLAIISAATNSNNSIYMALVNEYGDDIDIYAQSMLNFNTGPFFTLLIIGSFGNASIPFSELIGVIIPIFIGMILGNLDKDIRNFFEKGISMIIPFIGFCVGSTIDLREIINGGINGIILGIIVLIGTGIPLIIIDKLINRRPGYAGAALSSTAGNAVATPMVVGVIDSSFLPFVKAATTQIAAAVITTIILTPLLTYLIVNIKNNKRVYINKL